ncbi:MAG: nuclear transport factor 2 family protein [Pseudoruegeria sp.]
MTQYDSSPSSALMVAVQSYFDALYHCDVDLLDQVFHPSASLFDADEGRIFVDPIACYRDTIFRRTSPAQSNAVRQDEILYVDSLSEVSATVKVRVRIHNDIFVDHLMFAKEGNAWRIVAKLWSLQKQLDSEPS